MAMKTTPFWEQKTLQEMSVDEWESLCDGCGKCCLNKLEDEDSGEVFYTCVACEQLDPKKGGCRNYERRFELVPGCIDLRAADVSALYWLPSSCAYRLVLERKPLPEWHPLITGNSRSVHQADASVLGKIYSESLIPAEDLEDYIIHWVD